MREKEMDSMNTSSMRGIILSILVFSISLAIIPNVYAENVNAKSIGFEETTIIEFTNDGATDVNSFRIWLGSDFSFKSFKTEKGWVGEKTPQGVIVFTSPEAVKPGESIKIGVKTDKISTGINWKALDKSDKQIAIGKTVAGEIPEPQVVTKSSDKTVSENGILEKSVFRIVPEKPNLGSTIRVTGENFGATQEFDFIIDSKKIGSFVTNDAGYFITTMKIPEKVSGDRIDFIVKDKKGEEKKISLRLGLEENRIPDKPNIDLTVKGIPKVIHRGDFLEISGTATPSSGVTIEIHGPDGEVVRTRSAEADSKGNWALEPLLVPLDRPFGEYTGIISDGRQEKSAKWTLESSKVIIITPEVLKFEPGSPMRFNGTAIPNTLIELVLQDPLGAERFSDIIQVDASGKVELEYPTIANVDKEGTWTLIATQGKNKEFTYAGLGQVPSIPINMAFDKLNYKSTEKAVITLSGKPSEVLSMIIIDPSDKTKKIDGENESVSITLSPDGRGTYNLDLKGYASGVYTAVVSKGASKSTAVFAVGLQTGSGDIDINTTKLQYNPGDPVLILGQTNPNILLTMTLYDPSGNEVKIRESFSNKNGKISEDGFRIPTQAQPGKWQIKAVSGSNFDTQEITVSATKIEGMVINVEKGMDIPGFGKTMKIVIQGAFPKAVLGISIHDNNGVVIDDSLKCSATQSGSCEVLWTISKELPPGKYVIKADDGHDTAESTFDI